MPGHGGGPVDWGERGAQRAGQHAAVEPPRALRRRQRPRPVLARALHGLIHIPVYVVVYYAMQKKVEY